MVLLMLWTFIVGTAGSGKSLLAASMEKWLTSSEMSVTVVNLDPGVESPPYTSDVDIREYVDYWELMDKFNLGPNGGLVASIDMAVNQIEDFRQEILDMGRDYVIVDCPGQMELFAYRNSGPLMVSSLKGQDIGLSLYLLDSNIARTPKGYLSSILLGVSINIRFGLPQLNVLSKPDILTKEEVDRIVEWSSNQFVLEEAVDATTQGLVRQYSRSILRLLDDTQRGATVIPVSGKMMTGMEHLYGEMQRIFAGGEDYSPGW
ncbi:MAG: GTPase [Candidatus Lokiarchaeota archaeon]|nr:GTPase [Candidatus Lokiarchaeota archaeon]